MKKSPLVRAMTIEFSFLALAQVELVIWVCISLQAASTFPGQWDVGFSSIGTWYWMVLMNSQRSFPTQLNESQVLKQNILLLKQCGSKNFVLTQLPDMIRPSLKVELSRGTVVLRVSRRLLTRRVSVRAPSPTSFFWSERRREREKRKRKNLETTHKKKRARERPLTRERARNRGLDPKLEARKRDSIWRMWIERPFDACSIQNESWSKKEEVGGIDGSIKCFQSSLFKERWREI